MSYGAQESYNRLAEYLRTLWRSCGAAIAVLPSSCRRSYSSRTISRSRTLRTPQLQIKIDDFPSWSPHPHLPRRLRQEQGVDALTTLSTFGTGGPASLHDAAGRDRPGALAGGSVVDMRAPDGSPAPMTGLWQGDQEAGAPRLSVRYSRTKRACRGSRC